MSVQAFINGSWTTVADIGVPPGVVTMWAGQILDVGGHQYGPNTGWLICNGQAVPTSSFPGLFQAINTLWVKGDINVTTFNVPDLQEAAPAGAGQSARAEDSHDNFSLATFTDDVFQGHAHKTTVSTNQPGNAYDGALAGNNGVVMSQWNPTQNVLVPDNSHGNPRAANVTRGKRVWIHFIIKT